MKVYIDTKDRLVIDSENTTESFALRCWIEKNPVSEKDGVKMLINCLPELHSQEDKE